jgi:hypothetical protein
MDSDSFIWVVGVLAVWWILQIWVFPKLGVPT